MKLLRIILCVLLAAVLAVPVAAATQENPFSDVTPEDWAYDYILRTYEEGIMYGTYVARRPGPAASVRTRFSLWESGPLS